MIETTYVRFVTVYREANNNTLVSMRILNSHKVSCLFVESFQDGYATVQPPKGTYIHDFAEIIAGCLIKDSNFDFEVLKAYNRDVYDAFNGIKFNFNNISITLTKKITDSDEICKKWIEKSSPDTDENQAICIGELPIV